MGRHGENVCVAIGSAKSDENKENDMTLHDMRNHEKSWSCELSPSHTAVAPPRRTAAKSAPAPPPVLMVRTPLTFREIWWDVLSAWHLRDLQSIHTGWNTMLWHVRTKSIPRACARICWEFAEVPPNVMDVDLTPPAWHYLGQLKQVSAETYQYVWEGRMLMCSERSMQCFNQCCKKMLAWRLKLCNFTPMCKPQHPPTHWLQSTSILNRGDAKKD